jgi:predicted nucleic acid-binding protein
MKAFLDTSVLVAAFSGEHQHHGPSFALFVRQKKSTACTAAYCLAGVYSVLTGMPGKDKASPDEALLFLGDVRDRLTLITLDATEYVKTIEAAAGAGISGGAINDALTGCGKRLVGTAPLRSRLGKLLQTQGSTSEPRA